jgi:hypothetical protein
VAFDLESAKPVAGGFDLASARPVAAPASSAAPKSGGPLTPFDLAIGGPEALANMASGMFAGPVSQIAGLGGIVRDAMNPGSEDPAATQRTVQEALTYQPRTKMGELLSKYNPVALAGKAVDWAGGKVEKGVEKVPVPAAAEPFRDAAARGLGEATRQAPGFLGAGGGSVARAGAAKMESGAQGFMTSALKPNRFEHKTGKAADAAKTMLDEGLNVTEGGVQTLKGPHWRPERQDFYHH